MDEAGENMGRWEKEKTFGVEIRKHERIFGR